MIEEKYPARIHVLIASNSDNALIIRRGPSKQTCIIGWNRRKGTFEVSQWIKGRIYERRSDISPSGKHWIYFAMNGKWDSEAKGAWTAIAQAPWLKAISMFPKGDCWNGGGLFLNDKSYWLNDGYGHEIMHDSHEVKRNKDYLPQNQYGGECLNVYYNRLQRDGWVIKSTLEKRKWNTETIFEKEIAKKWTLRKVCHAQVDSPKGKGCYWDEHELLSSSDVTVKKPNWEWADWVDGRIYYAEQGFLFKLNIQSCNKLSEPKILHNFNNYKFENKTAPY